MYLNSRANQVSDDVRQSTQNTSLLNGVSTTAGLGFGGEEDRRIESRNEGRNRTGEHGIGFQGNDDIESGLGAEVKKRRGGDRSEMVAVAPSGQLKTVYFGRNHHLRL